MTTIRYGGQAVIEGVMMKNKERYAVAVRKPDGEIEVTTDTYKSAPTEKLTATFTLEKKNDKWIITGIDE